MSNKVNGFRIICRLAMAELMLRKQENRARQGFKLLEFQEACRSLERIGAIKIQAIPTYADLMDFALCFVLRFEARHMLNHANIQLEIASRIAPEFKHHKFLNDRKQDRKRLEDEEDQEFESDDELFAWHEAEAAKAQSERNKQRKAEALAAAEQAEKERQEAVRFMQENPEIECSYKDLWAVMRDISERQGFKIPEGYEPTVVITEPDFVPGGADQAKDRLRRNEHQ